MTAARQRLRAEKDALRRAVLAARDSLPPGLRVEASRTTCKILFERLSGEKPTVVASFWPLGSELDLRSLMQDLLRKGFGLSLPRIDDQRLRFRTWDGDERSLSKGPLGTRQPGEFAEIIDPAIVLVPFVAIDERGFRLGYGKGYYDAALADLAGRSAALTIAAGFEAQCVSRVPVEEHDWPVDWIATERGIRRREG